MGDTKQTATNEQFYSALRGDTAGKNAEVSRGYSTSNTSEGRPERRKEDDTLMCSETAMSPNGGADFRRGIEERPLDPVTVEHVVKRDNMLSAWKQVKANKGAPGIEVLRLRSSLSMPMRTGKWEGQALHCCISLYQQSYQIQIYKASLSYSLCLGFTLARRFGCYKPFSSRFFNISVR